MKSFALPFLRNRVPHTVRTGVIACCLMAVAQPPAFANPKGGKVVAGNAEIAEALGKLMVSQGSDRAVIEWESFSIDAGEITQFLQPGSNSAALNRVMGASPSVLNGLLKANGNIWLINQNGIMVGPNGMVDVGGFVASTLDVDNDDFLRGGDVMLKGNSDASIKNFGTIKAAGGDIFLVGREIENHGVLGAFEGTVGLAGGNQVLLKAKGAGNERIFVSGGEGRVTNTGEIRGVMAELKAHGNAYALAINNSGVVRASGTDQQGGRVMLKASSGDIVSTGELSAINADGSGGSVEIENGAGEIQIGGLASASSLTGRGGQVRVVGEGINVMSAAVIEANGSEGGGIKIGGSSTRAVTVGEGALVTSSGTAGLGGRVEVNGGEIVVYKNSTLGANGETNGGMVAVTGSDRVKIDGGLRATATTGNGGSISLTGPTLTLGADSALDVNGETQGGSVNMNSTELTRSSGLVSASGASGGSISLQGGRRLEVDGQVEALGRTIVGGRIDAIADEVALETGALFDVSGNFRGGALNVGGSYQGTAIPSLRNSIRTMVSEGVALRADSALGSAGQAVVWSDGITDFSGDVSARAFGPVGRGGLIEISGKEDLLFRGTVTAKAVGGQSGTVLFDPGSIIIAGAGSTVPVSSLNTILQSGTNVIVATHSGTIRVDEIGTANFNDRHNAVQWTSDASLGLFASGNIFIHNHIRTSGAGSINLIAGWLGSEADLLPSVGLVNPIRIPNALGIEVGSLLKTGTILPAGSILNGAAFAQTLTSDTLITSATTIASGGTIAADSIITEVGGGAFEPNPPLSVEGHWTSYLNSEKFGESGSVFIGARDLDRHVEVGSRYGNTNVAANSLVMTAPRTNADSLWTQLGFHDSGVTLLAPRAAGTGLLGLDLHDTNNNNIVRSIRQDGPATLNATTLDTRVLQGAANATSSTGFDPAFAPGATTITLRDSGQDSAASSAIKVGDLITGTGIAPHTYVTAIAGDVITLSKPTNAAGSNSATYASDGYRYTFSQPGVSAIAIVGQNEVDRLAYVSPGTLGLGTDGIVDGVELVNESGRVAGTYMSYANHYNSATQGNWWWQRIEAVGSPERTGGVGANRPEWGAGTASKRADINIALTGALSMDAGGRRNNAVQIGHGGIGSTLEASRSEVGGNRGILRNELVNTVDSVNQNLITTQFVSSYSINGGGSGMVNQSIARLKPIYSNINVITGIDRSAGVTFDGNSLSASVVDGTGDIALRGWQSDLTASNAATSGQPNDDAGFGYAQIGHLGGGQFGSVRGDVNVKAGGNVTLLGGRQSYAWATIGHTFGGALNDWNNPANEDAQVRIFSNAADFDNPNWRLGELYAQVGGGNSPARGAFPSGYDPVVLALAAPNANVLRGPAYWDVGFDTAFGGTSTTDSAAWKATTGTASASAFVPSFGTGRSATGKVTPTSVAVASLKGLTDKTIVGDVTVTSNGEAGVTMSSGFTLDLGGSTLVTAFDPTVGDSLAVGTYLPKGSILNGTTVGTERGDVLSVATSVVATTRILAGGFIGAGSSVSGPGLTQDNKLAYIGRATQIGHGGIGAGRGEIGGLSTSLAVFGAPGVEDSGSRDNLLFNGAAWVADSNLAGPALVTTNRSITGLNLVGNVTVTASNGAVGLTAGNHRYDYSMIGHGGAELADLESSNIALGDVKVWAKTNVSIRGSAVEYTSNSTTISPLRSFAKIGHGGYLDNFSYKSGDINVTADTGKLTMVAGRLQGQFAQIGHSGISSYGRVGGNFNRDEVFQYANESVGQRVNVGASLTGSTLILYGGVNGIASGGFTTTAYDNTANITVYTGGDILMDHERAGLVGSFTYFPVAGATTGGVQIGNNLTQTANNINAGNQNAWSLIGHGGWDVDQVSNAQPASGTPLTTGEPDDSFLNQDYREADKVGNISVTGLGDLTMSGGDTLFRWSAIGHFVNGNGLDRSFVSAGDTFSGLKVGGLIDVKIAKDVLLDAAYVGDTPTFYQGVLYDKSRSRNAEANGLGLGLPAQYNPVRIGHGGVYDVRNYVVVDKDQSATFGTINSIAADSDITLRAGGDLSVLGGRGGSNSFSQVGHGFVTDLGVDPLNYRGSFVGVSGNILAVTAGDLKMTGGTRPDGSTVIASATTPNIGHALTALFGDTKVSVGENARFDRTYVGHAKFSGVASDTFVGVSGILPSYKLGGRYEFETTAGDIFNSGGSGQLRLYMPNRPSNLIAVNTLLNGTPYTDPSVTDPPASGDAVSFAAKDARGDEYITSTGYFDHEIFYAPGDPKGVPSGSFTANDDVTKSGYPAPGPNGIGAFYGIYYNNSGPGLPVPPPVLPQGGSNSTLFPIVDVFDPRSVPAFGKIDRYEIQDQYVDGSFFNFTQWRNPSGRAPYTVDYMGGLGLGSSLVMNLRGFVVPAPLNLDDVLPEEPTNSTVLDSEEERRRRTAAEPAFRTTTEGSGVQTQMPAADDPFGAPAPGTSAPAMDDPFGTPAPAPGATSVPPAMEDPFATPPPAMTPPAPGATPPSTN